MIGESQEPVGAGVGGSQSSNKTPTLEEYGTNLTNSSRRGELHLILASATALLPWAAISAAQMQTQCSAVSRRASVCSVHQ